MKDFLGREVNPGDYFAYPLILGRSATMALYQFVSVNEKGNVKARKIEASYDSALPVYKYKKFVYNQQGGGKYVEMTPEERIKVDNKLSTLLCFTDRACLTTYEESK